MIRIMTDKQFKDAIDRAISKDREEQYKYEKIVDFYSEIQALKNDYLLVSPDIFKDICERLIKLESKQKENSL